MDWVNKHLQIVPINTFIDPTKGDSFQTDKALAAIKQGCLLYTSPSPRDRQKSRMPSSA